MDKTKQNQEEYTKNKKQLMNLIKSSDIDNSISLIGYHFLPGALLGSEDLNMPVLNEFMLYWVKIFMNK